MSIYFSNLVEHCSNEYILNELNSKNSCFVELSNELELTQLELIAKNLKSLQTLILPPNLSSIKLHQILKNLGSVRRIHLTNDLSLEELKVIIKALPLMTVVQIDPRIITPFLEEVIPLLPAYTTYMTSAYISKIKMAKIAELMPAESIFSFHESCIPPTSDLINAASHLNEGAYFDCRSTEAPSLFKNIAESLQPNRGLTIKNALSIDQMDAAIQVMKPSTKLISFHSLNPDQLDYLNSTLRSKENISYNQLAPLLQRNPLNGEIKITLLPAEKQSEQLSGRKRKNNADVGLRASTYNRLLLLADTCNEANLIDKKDEETKENESSITFS